MNGKITTKAEFDEQRKKTPKGYFEYYCSQCGKSARYNTPYIDNEGKIWCDRCSKKSIVMMQGVDQHTLEITADRQEFTKNGALVWRENEKLSNAWLKDGAQSVPIHEDERLLTPEVFLDKILAEQSHGDYRCTTCQKTFHGEPAGFPLFAGICCAECMKKHSALLEKERKTGRVCSMCHEPYSNCCC